MFDMLSFFVRVMQFDTEFTETLGGEIFSSLDNEPVK